jgi:polygalacturonase
MQYSRREFLGAGGIGAAGAAIASHVPWAARLVAERAARQQVEPAGDPWLQAEGILRRIAPPRIPSRDFDIRTFGARGDGERDCTSAFRSAIAECQTAGGGRIVVPAGRFSTGAIRLRTGVELHLEEGATLAFSRDPRQYPIVMTRFEGIELMNYSPFIYAFEERDIAITGRGTLDGQADAEHWWPWKGGARAAGTQNQNAARARLSDFSAKGIPVAERVFGGGSYMRTNFVQPYRCQNVIIDGPTIVNSPMWEINPVLCRNVIVRGLTISSHGPNNDGCDPESCTDVLIERCTFDTGDDCIAIKSGRNEDGRRLNAPSENIVIRDCVMKDGHGGVVIGSEVSGSVRNVFAERCRMDSPRLDRVLRLKTNSVRGGVVEHVYMRDVTVGEVSDAILSIDFSYEEGDTGKFPPVVRDIELRRVSSRRSKHALLLKGYASAPIRDVRLIDCTLDGVQSPDVVEHVENLVFTNVRVNGQARNGPQDD